MIETLTQNIDLIQTGLSVLSVPAFILVVTSLFKKKVGMYTPFIAVAIGVIIGILIALYFVGIDFIAIIAGIIFGTITGASAVGIKVIADGEPAPEQFDWE